MTFYNTRSHTGEFAMLHPENRFFESTKATLIQKKFFTQYRFKEMFLNQSSLF